ncbi:MAG: branched-chain amino acid ABC transporter permease [Deltaproteobacteria bacterium]|nr:branched-chain amino acid ABC transporter permease [Deltaproteobacteria bacterium]
MPSALPFKRFRAPLVHLLILSAACSIPFFAPQYYQKLAIEALLLAVLAMSLDMIMGYAGIASFGHAAYFGLGGYTLGAIIKFLVPSIWLALLSVTVTTGLLALFIGIISIRARGIYFAILTLAFAEVLYRIIFHTYSLGGSDGLVAIPVPNLNLLIFNLDLTQSINFYFLAVAFAYISYLICSRMVGSPFGRVLKGIRDNENRVGFLGFNVKRYKVTVFVLSGIFAGWSGALFSLFKTFADTEQLHFLMSGKVIVMTLIGGLGTLVGPMVGAVFLTIFETIVSSYFKAHSIITGAIFVLVVIFLPKGILGLFSNQKNRS